MMRPSAVARRRKVRPPCLDGVTGHLTHGLEMSQVIWRPPAHPVGHTPPHEALRQPRAANPKGNSRPQHHPTKGDTKPHHDDVLSDAELLEHKTKNHPSQLHPPM